MADTTKIAMAAAKARARAPLSEADRQCGSCTLCCTLLPVVTLEKKAGKRCTHQRSLLDVEGAGCAVYRKAGFPNECGLWACRWLVDPTTTGLMRPDATHYVIDIVPDFITVVAVDGRQAKIPVIQLWADPLYPDAHRDPKFREWMVNNEPECAVLVRLDHEKAVFLLPPQMSSLGRWEEQDEAMGVESTHKADEVAAVLHQSGAMK